MIRMASPKAPSKPKVLFAARLDQADFDRLHATAAREGTTASDLVREAIAKLFAERRSA
jgi:predicted DNA-binding protein